MNQINSMRSRHWEASEESAATANSSTIVKPPARRRTRQWHATCTHPPEPQAERTASNGRVSTILDAVITGQKTLTTPGGYLVWNVAWPAAEYNQRMGDAVTSFLTTEELLHR